MLARSLATLISAAILASFSLAQPPEGKANITDTKIAAAFGPGGAELKFPLRIWIPDNAMVIAAQEFKVSVEGNIILTGPASVGVFHDAAAPNIFRGDKVTVVANEATTFGDLAKAKIMLISVHSKQSTASFTPTRSSGDGVNFGSLPAISPPPTPTKIRALEEELEIRARQQLITQLMTSRPSTDVNVRFKFKIADNAPRTELVPSAPTKAVQLPPPLNEDLTRVPELMFREPIAKNLDKIRALEDVAHVMAKANHLNARKTDGFMDALIKERGDLRGLPFLMGEECRTRDEQARFFARVVDTVHQTLRNARNKGLDDAPYEFWRQISALQLQFTEGRDVRMFPQKANDRMNPVHSAVVAALTQIMMPESEAFRIGLARYLGTIPHADATKALARLAIFSQEDDVRALAIANLKVRRERDYADILMEGFRYPLPEVSKRAAEAIVKLELKDATPQLIEVLERPDPRLPVSTKNVAIVREVVKVNHHHNCLLCHAPANTEDVPEAVLKVAVPLPIEPLPRPTESGGYQSNPPAPDVAVRIDMTYLRQDFSLMMPVADAHPWPEMQRFDFLVRTRELTAEEARAYPKAEDVQEGKLSPYHRSALFALRELTGRDTAPTAEAWRKLLRLSKAS